MVVCVRGFEVPLTLVHFREHSEVIALYGPPFVPRTTQSSLWPSALCLHATATLIRGRSKFHNPDSRYWPTEAARLASVIWGTASPPQPLLTKMQISSNVFFWMWSLAEPRPIFPFAHPGLGWECIPTDYCKDPVVFDKKKCAFCEILEQLQYPAEMSINL